MKLDDGTTIKSTEILFYLLFILLYEIVMFFIGQREDSSKIEKDNIDLSAQIEVSYHNVIPPKDNLGILSISVSQDDLRIITGETIDLLTNIHSKILEFQPIIAEASEAVQKNKDLTDSKVTGDNAQSYLSFINLSRRMDNYYMDKTSDIDTMFEQLKTAHFQAKIQKLDEKLDKGIAQLNLSYNTNLDKTENLIKLLKRRSLDDNLNVFVNIVFPMAFGFGALFYAMYFLYNN